MSALIRPATAADGAGVAAIYAPVVAHTPTSFELAPPDDAEMARRIADTLPRFPWLVCEQEGQTLAYAYASRHRARPAYQWSVDTSVYVDPAWHRRGVGRSLYRSLHAILVLQGYFNAYAGIALPNPGSVGLHEAVGYRPVGVYREVGFKAGAWHDVGWWQLALQPKTAAPPPPLPLDRVRTAPGWSAALAAGEALLKFCRPLSRAERPAR